MNSKVLLKIFLGYAEPALFLIFGVSMAYSAMSVLSVDMDTNKLIIVVLQFGMGFMLLLTSAVLLDLKDILNRVKDLEQSKKEV